MLGTRKSNNWIFLLRVVLFIAKKMITVTWLRPQWVNGGSIEGEGEGGLQIYFHYNEPQHFLFNSSDVYSHHHLSYP